MVTYNDYEHSITFSLTKRFFKDVNIPNRFTLTGMSEDTFEIILCSSLPDNIYNCIWDDGQSGTPGTLKQPSEVTGWNTITIEGIPNMELYTTFINDGESGFVIHVGNEEDIQINVGDKEEIVLKGIIIARQVPNSTAQYMLAYARLSSPIHVQNFITIPMDGDLGSVGTCPSTIKE